MGKKGKLMLAAVVILIIGGAVYAGDHRAIAPEISNKASSSPEIAVTTTSIVSVAASSSIAVPSAPEEE